MALDPLLVAYVGVVAVLTVTPGPDMALVAKHAWTRGRRGALLATLGISTGLLVHAVASSAGLSVILAQSATAFTWVKAAGAAYLVYLGARTLHDSWRGRGRRARDPAADAEDRDGSGDARAPDGGAGAGTGTGEAPARAPGDDGPLAAYGEGLVTNVLNPKVAVFYLAFLPQFIRPTDPVLLRALLLAGIHVGLGLLWLPLYAHGLVALRDRVADKRGRLQRWLERVTGGVLVALGAKLLLERDGVPA